MKSNHRSPIWPYLIVLAALFVLSVTAPRAWQTRPGRSRVSLTLARSPDNPKQRAIVLRAEPSPATNNWVQAPAIRESDPRIGSVQLFQVGNAENTSVAEPGNATAELSATNNQQEFNQDHTESAGSTRIPDGDASFVSIDDPPSNPSLNDPYEEPASDESDLDAAVGQLDPRPAPVAPGEPTEDSHENWPEPYALIDKLDELKDASAIQPWSNNVRRLIGRMVELRIDDPASAKLLTDLRTASRQMLTTVEPLPEPVRRLFEQTRLDLVRRLGVWEKAGAASSRELVSAPSEDIDSTMQAAIALARETFATAPQGETWRQYLLIDRLDRWSGDTSDNSIAERRRLARIVLLRLADPQLSPAQLQFLAEPRLSPLKRCLRTWAIEPLPVGELLYAIEDYEQERAASLGRRLADQSAALGASRDAAQNRLGRELSRQYRNANLRIVVTREFLNRLLPQPPTAAEPVQDVIVGVPARGTSTTTSHLSVRFHPAAGELRFAIEAAGEVDSQTASTAGPVTFLSQGQSTYKVGKLVMIDRNGIRADRAIADATNRTQLSGLQTDFDGVPLVRSLVRNYALSQHDEKKAQAQQEVEAKVAARATERLDSEISARLAKLEADFRRRVLAPLRQIDLQPSVVELTTSEDRLTGRLRIAGDDQAAAHTPRPLAMSDSLASLQLHESALNNALDRFQLAGRTFTAPELYQWIGRRLGRSQVQVPDDIPEKVVVKFPNEDPVRVQCNEGRVELKLAIAELDDGRHFWQDFEVTVSYRPQFDGLHLEFARDGAIELGGEYAGRTEFVLRGIFAKVFSQRRKLVLDLAGERPLPGLATLSFSSALVDNGWISVTVAERKR